MTSLLKRLSRLFPESVRLEDHSTEAVARLFERRPDLCLAWLKEDNVGFRPFARGCAVSVGAGLQPHHQHENQREYC